ncbi:MAG TPA: glycosyltransferase family 2 protein [Cyclobacteriaceae bacterium]|nr:glycosyltransferase family 2 protein [Cyclobacteriaceae bacterium]
MTLSIKESSVAIILLNWNGFSYTKACIDSLKEIDYPDWQVILVDNGSTDGSLEKLKASFPNLVYLEAAKNLGFTGGNNLGISYALESGYPYILLLNNDTLVERGFLGPMVSYLVDTPSCAAAQPLIYYVHDKRKVWNAGGHYQKWLVNSQTLYHISQHSQPYPTDWITGCAILVKAGVIRAVGLLDDNYFAYHEDVDWSLRIRKAEWHLAVVPQSKIYHVAGAASTAKERGKEGLLDPKVHYLNIRNQIFQLRKYGTFPYALTAWPYHVVKLLMYLGYFVMKGRWGKMKAILRGARDGMAKEIIR